MANNTFDITESAVLKFTDGVEKTENSILRRINKIMRSLELDGDNIKPNRNNLKILRTLQQEIVKIIVNPAYLNKVDVYLKAFDKIQKSNDGYFKFLSDYNPKSHSLLEIKRGNLTLAKNSLTEAGIRESVVNPVMKLLEQGITSGISFDDMEQSLKKEIIGIEKSDGTKERLGSLERYTKQITRDALNQYSRNHVTSVANQNDMEWYFYEGGKREDTRSYCVKRRGKYFHKNEVEKSSKKTWPGKIPTTNSTNIFIYCGGFNCIHEYMPVLIDVVPKSVIQRNIRNKNYIPPST